MPKSATLTKPASFGMLNATIKLRDAPDNSNDKIMGFFRSGFEPVYFNLHAPPETPGSQQFLEDMKKVFRARKRISFDVTINAFPNENESSGNYAAFRTENTEALLLNKSDTEFSIIMQRVQRDVTKLSNLHKGYAGAFLMLYAYPKTGPRNGNYLEMTIDPVKEQQGKITSFTPSGGG